ncbi:MAG: hypothetical protein SX243_12000 [Acidobacteriota bacterium]|nr:hypothetical protein [Acidobacteriota bacterium]
MTAMIRYDGILVRASLEDTGELPRSGPLQESPDVSPQGKTVVEDPQTYFRDTYEENVGKPVVAGEPNLVYLRGKNTGDFAQGGTAFLYWASEADLGSPARWKNNRVFTADGSDRVTLGRTLPGEVVVGEVPFVYSPPANDAGANIALLGVVATNEHPNPVPGLGNSIDFDRWVSRQGGVGVLQATLQPPPKQEPTFTTKAQFDLGNTEGEVSFFIKTAGIPLGWKVSFEAEKPAPDGYKIELPLSTINADPFTQGTFANLDANYNSPITFNLFAGEGLPAKENYVTVYAGQYEEVAGAQKSDHPRVFAAEGDAPQVGAADPGRFVIQAQYTTKINVPTAET